MYVYGGLDGDRRVLDDLIVLKLSSKWFGMFNLRAPRSHTTSSSAMVHDTKNGTKSKQTIGSCHGF